MVSHLFFYQLTLIALVWLCLMLQWVWPSDLAAGCPTTPEPPGPRPKRRREPTPFAGLTTKPHCDACEHATAPRPQAPSAPPPRIVMTRGRRRQVDTARHFCPNPDCAYRGWVGWGNLRANGHPNGGPWRQLLCVACRGSFLETLGTLFHGKRGSAELIVRVIACLAEGLGIRGTARVCEVEANTVLQWLVEAAEQLRPSPSISCMTCGSGRSNWMRCLRCSVRSRRVRSVRRTPSRAWSVPRSGSGPRWTPRANCYWPSTSGIGRSRWRSVWSTTSRRCWRLAVHPSF